jgi:hypothetical protein
MPSTRRPARPQPSPKNRPAPTEDSEHLVEDAAGWSKVRSGLRLVQLGLVLGLLYPLCHLGVVAYTVWTYGKAPDRLVKPPLGLLEVKGLSLFAELQIFAWLVGAALSFVFCAIGLIKCLRVPNAARTNGIVGGTLFFGLLCAVGILITSVADLRKLDLFDVPDLPSEVLMFGERSLPYLALLTISWFAIFMAQSAQPLRSSKVLTDIAFSVLLLVLLRVGVIITDYYYPLTLSAPKLPKDKLDELSVTDAAVWAILTALTALRIASIAGVVRRAIRRWMEDNENALAGAAG